MINSSPLLNIMTAAALKAGKGLMRDFGEVDQLQVSRKGIANFVTKSDVRTENLLRAELEKARPGYSFLLEEGGSVEGRTPEYRWIIDPIDGTSNFIHAIPYFCISIGLEKRAGGTSEIIAGVIFDPIHNEMFTAEKGKGALMNNRKLTGSNRERLDESMLASGTPRFVLDEYKNAIPVLEKVVKTGATVRYFGAMALDLANVAAGRLDGCWYHIAQPWDIAAAILIAQEAGCVVSELNGNPAGVMSKNIIAGNRSIAPALQNIFASI